MIEKNVRLKMEMFKQGISQRELAHMANIPEAYLSRIVRGIQNPNADQIFDIAKALEVNEEELFG